MKRAPDEVPQQLLSARSTLILYAGFILTGVVTTLLGPLLPALSAKWNMQDAQSGALFAVQFAGATLGTLFSGYISAALGSLRALAAGFALMVAGVLALAFASWSVGVAAVLAYGFALGVTVPLTNLLVSDTSPHRRAAALNQLNVMWTVGAVLSPPILGRWLRTGELRAPLIGLAALLAVIALWNFLSPPIRGASHQDPAAPGKTANRGPRLVALFCVMTCFYVGTENAVSGWVAVLAKRLEGSDGALWAIAPSVFWAALMGGRLIAPLALRRLSEHRLILIGLALAAVGATTLIASRRMTDLFLGAAIAGLGLGPIYPTTIAIFSDSFKGASARISGLFFAFGNFGGAFTPWAVGLLSTMYGNLRIGLLIPLLASLILIGVQILIQKNRSAEAM